MDAVLLARIQFAFTVGFHYLFPPLTLGLTLVILIFQTLGLKRPSEVYQSISAFLIRILGLVFVLGTATGITMEFAFGNNWAEYARLVGDIFGAPLAAEGIFAFFLESVFLGILLFGRARVSRAVYWLSSFLVFLGAHLSGLWILIANSWMQTPAGFRMEGKKAILTNFWEAALNPSLLERYTHTIVAGWITGALFVAGIAAWFLLRKQHDRPARSMLKVSLALFVVTALLQFGTGHMHAVQVGQPQPAKMAAFEALWQSQEGAPLALLGWPDTERQETRFLVAIPRLLSFLLHFDPKARVTGLNEFPREEWPPVLPTFLAYHGMIALGSLFALLALWALFLYRFRPQAFYGNPLFLKALLFAIPLPQIANQLGWMAAEIGRQPWAVYGVLKTSQAVSATVSTGQLLFSLTGFALLYGLLLVMFIHILLRLIRKGPVNPEPQGY